jgi:putative mycofactocin binding protein MftB
LKLSDRVRLDDAVALRPERFFVDHALLPFVESAGGHTLGEIAGDLEAAGKVSKEALPRLLTVLEGLRRRGVLHVL